MFSQFSNQFLKNTHDSILRFCRLFQVFQANRINQIHISLIEVTQNPDIPILLILVDQLLISRLYVRYVSGK
jgi:hypothetical protein